MPQKETDGDSNEMLLGIKRVLPALIIIGVLVAAVGGGVALLRSSRPGGKTVEPAPLKLSVAVVAPQRLTAGVSVTLEEFGDYQCPPCGLLHPQLKTIKAEYGNRLNFIFRNLPLAKIHKNAQAAAQAAEAARLQDRFWPMHDALYEHQTEWKDVSDPLPVFLKYARQIGLDLRHFAQDSDSAEVKDKIEGDTRRAESLGIDGTPTILIEGRQLKVEAMTAEGIHQGLDAMLRQKSQNGTQPQSRP